MALFVKWIWLSNESKLNGTVENLFELSTAPALNSRVVKGALTWHKIFYTSKPLILPNLLPQTIVEYRILRHESKVVFRYTFERPICLIEVFKLMNQASHLIGWEPHGEAPT